MLTNNAQISPYLQVNSAAVSAKIEQFIRQEVEKQNKRGVVIGLSGGLDSAVVTALSVRSFGKERVLALILPERDTHSTSIDHAYLLANQLGIKVNLIQLTPILRKIGTYRLVPPTFFSSRKMQEQYVQKRHTTLATEVDKPLFLYNLSGGNNEEMNRSIAFYRTKHRLRMINLYLSAEKENRLVVGTANKSEWFTGFFVQYGDSAADLMPIIGLYKTQVRQLAEYLNVPKEIIEKPPSPDLIPGITDEYALGIPYAQLDIALFGIDQDWDDTRIAQEAKVDLTKVTYIRELVAASAKWRQFPPSCMI